MIQSSAALVVAVDMAPFRAVPVLSTGSRPGSFTAEGAEHAEGDMGALSRRSFHSVLCASSAVNKAG